MTDAHDEAAKALVEKLSRVQVLRPMPEQLYEIARQALRKAALDETHANRNAISVLLKENDRLRALATVPLNQAVVDEAARKAAKGEREQLLTWLRNKPGVSYKATLRDIEEFDRARAKGGT